MAQDMNAPIAIIGLACRFPGASCAEEYWSLLMSGQSAIQRVPPSRWDWQLYYQDQSKRGTIASNQGGFIADLEYFDWEFFGLTALQASRLDPQQKLAMEVSWGALENACIVPRDLAGSGAAVIMGVAHGDHARKLKNDFPSINGDEGPHSYGCFISNRISHFLNLKGPSYVVNSACSSSLLAVHLACQSLRTFETDLALSGGVNVHLLPEESVSSTVAGWLSADGKCKSFREKGDGFVRGEGCGIVVLKRLKDALDAEDHIWGVIRGGAIGHNGLCGGITTPNAEAQRSLIRQALKHARVEPAQIDYIEAHGTGTSGGDSIEASAFMDVLSQRRSANNPLLVGCAKPNIGHLEAASGIAGLIKVALCMKHQSLPAILHLDELNRWIPKHKPCSFLSEPRQWPARTDTQRLAAVSNFGFGGANAVLILEEGPAALNAPLLEEDGPKCICFRARTQTSLNAAIARFRASHLELSDAVIYSANVRRSEFPVRAAFSAENRQALRACVLGEKAGHVFYSKDFSTVADKGIAIVMPDDSQQSSMPWTLAQLQSWAVTARALESWCRHFTNTDIQLLRTDLSAPAMCRFILAFWGHFLREVGIRPKQVFAPHELMGVGHLVNGTAQLAEIASWITFGCAKNLTAQCDGSEGRCVFLSLSALRDAHALQHTRYILNLTRDHIDVPQGLVVVPLIKAGDWRKDFIDFLAKLFVSGIDINWKLVCFGKAHPIPSYAFERTYSWFDPSTEVVRKQETLHDTRPPDPA